MPHEPENRPLPSTYGIAAPFWEACSRHELMLQVCDGCGAHRYYPKPLCTECGASQSRWEKVSGHGSVYSFSVIYRAPLPAFASQTPYVLALIDLDEGARMLSMVVAEDHRAVGIGARVHVCFEDVSETVSLPLFRLTSDAGADNAGGPRRDTA